MKKNPDQPSRSSASGRATRGRERARYQWPALAGVLVVLVVLAGVKYGVADTGFVDSVYRYV